MQTSCLLEGPLGGPEPLGEGGDQRRRDRVAGRKDGARQLHLVNARLATHPAAGADREPASRAGLRPGTGERDGHGVPALVGGARRVAVPDGSKLAGRNEPLGDQETGSQFEIVPGGAHGHHHRFGLLTGSSRPDLERLLRGHPIRQVRISVGSDLAHPHIGDRAGESSRGAQRRPRFGGVDIRQPGRVGGLGVGHDDACEQVAHRPPARRDKVDGPTKVGYRIAGAERLGPPVDDGNDRALGGMGGQPCQRVVVERRHVGGDHEHRASPPSFGQLLGARCHGGERSRVGRAVGERGQPTASRAHFERRVRHRAQQDPQVLGERASSWSWEPRLVSPHAPTGAAGQQERGHVHLRILPRSRSFPPRRTPVCRLVRFERGSFASRRFLSG